MARALHLINGCRSLVSGTDTADVVWVRVWKCLAGSSQFRLSRLDSCHLAKQLQDIVGGCLASELTCIEVYVLNMKKKKLSTDIGELKMTPAKIRIRKTLKKDISLSFRPVLFRWPDGSMTYGPRISRQRDIYWSQGQIIRSARSFHPQSPWMVIWILWHFTHPLAGG